jgi:hypothetical protein
VVNTMCEFVYPMNLLKLDLLWLGLLTYCNQYGWSLACFGLLIGYLEMTLGYRKDVLRPAAYGLGQLFLARRCLSILKV